MRPIAQGEIPAYAGMTWEGAGMTVCPVAQGEIPAFAGMTWEGA